MKTILVPVDFSRCATNALTYAIDMLRVEPAHVVLQHTTPLLQGIDNNVYSVYYLEEYYKTKEKKLQQIAKSLERNPLNAKLTFKVEHSVGNPVDSLISLSEKLKPDFIVMGTKGATGLKEVFMGSTTAGVIGRSEVPVLAVPSGCVFDEKNKEFVLASDVSFMPNKASVNALLQIVNVPNDNVSILHVSEYQKGIPTKLDEQKISKILKDITHQFYYINSKEVTASILRFVKERNAGVLCMLSHKQSLFGRLFHSSVTKSVAHKIKVPLLALEER